MNTQNKTVEYNLEASEFQWDLAPGKTISAWGFNGQVPGPVLRASKGDTLVVRVTNKLSEPTVVHWHGIRLPAQMDGTEEVQKPIAAGETFEYKFQVPDAGTFWYHSHHNETNQVERGMYGAIVIEDKTDPVFDEERVLVFDDMKLTGDYQFTKPTWFLQRWDERHAGREGNMHLINGKEQPMFEIAAGQTERWRIVNASNARYIRLSLGGNAFKLIGTDGGLVEEPVRMNEILITPGERVDLAVGPFEAGDTFAIESLEYRRSPDMKKKRYTYGLVKVGEAKASVVRLPEQLRRIDSLAPHNAIVNRKVKLSVGLSLKDGVDFFVNNKIHVNDAPVKVGELQVWEVFNASLMDHPYHLHGFFFQVLEVDGNAPAYKAWKDTVNISPRSKVKIAWMPDNRPGRWMYHCHILEHHAAGMMASFEVYNDQPKTEHAHHGCAAA